MKPIKLTEPTYTISRAITILGLGSYQRKDAIEHVLISLTQLNLKTYVDTKQLNHTDICSEIDEEQVDEETVKLLASGKFKEGKNLVLELDHYWVTGNGVNLGTYKENKDTYYPTDITSIYYEPQYLSTDALFITQSAMKQLIGGKPTRSNQRVKEELFKQWLITNAQSQNLSLKLYYPKPDYNAIYQELFTHLSHEQIYAKLQQIYPREFSQQQQYFFKKLSVDIKFPKGSTKLRKIK